MKTIVTHQSPDLDALVAAWLARQWIVRDDDVSVVFASAGPVPDSLLHADVVVDTGRIWDPTNGKVDHHMPSTNGMLIGKDGNVALYAQASATSLVWSHVRPHGQAMYGDHYADSFDLIAMLVTNGDHGRPDPIDECVGLAATLRRIRAAEKTDRDVLESFWAVLDDIHADLVVQSAKIESIKRHTTYHTLNGYRFAMTTGGDSSTTHVLLRTTAVDVVVWWDASNVGSFPYGIQRSERMSGVDLRQIARALDDLEWQATHRQAYADVKALYLHPSGALAVGNSPKHTRTLHAVTTPSACDFARAIADALDPHIA